MVKRECTSELSLSPPPLNFSWLSEENEDLQREGKDAKYLNEGGSQGTHHCLGAHRSPPGYHQEPLALSLEKECCKAPPVRLPWA